VYDHSCKEGALAKDRNAQTLAVIGDNGWLSLKQASRLSGIKPAVLKRMIRSGELRAYTIARGGKRRFRVTRETLAAAGLPGGESSRQQAATVDLTALIREQNQRIAALESQRAMLAGQLGAALERLRELDDRVAVLETPRETELVEDRLVSERVGARGYDAPLRALIKTLPIPGSGRWRRDAVGS
jgi:hypothetical protein